VKPILFVRVATTIAVFLPLVWETLRGFIVRPAFAGPIGDVYAAAREGSVALAFAYLVVAVGIALGAIYVSWRRVEVAGTWRFGPGSAGRVAKWLAAMFVLGYLLSFLPAYTLSVGFADAVQNYDQLAAQAPRWSFETLAIAFLATIAVALLLWLIDVTARVDRVNTRTTGVTL
jgi:hypothetical protein